MKRFLQSRPVITRLFLILFIGVGLSLQCIGQNYTGKQKDIDQILENVRLFSQYYMAGEMDKLVDCYTDDGKIFPGNSDIISGKEGLSGFWVIREGSKVLHHQITPVELTVQKKIAYDYGYYEGIPKCGRGGLSFKGKYVIVWKKVGKDWKIYLDIWNRISG